MMIPLRSAVAAKRLQKGGRPMEWRVLVVCCLAAAASGFTPLPGVRVGCYSPWISGPAGPPCTPLAYRQRLRSRNAPVRASAAAVCAPHAVARLAFLLAVRAPPSCFDILGTR